MKNLQNFFVLFLGFMMVTAHIKPMISTVQFQADVAHTSGFSLLEQAVASNNREVIVQAATAMKEAADTLQDFDVLKIFTDGLIAATEIPIPAVQNALCRQLVAAVHEENVMFSDLIEAIPGDTPDAIARIIATIETQVNPEIAAGIRLACAVFNRIADDRLLLAFIAAAQKQEEEEEEETATLLLPTFSRQQPYRCITMPGSHLKRSP